MKINFTKSEYRTLLDVIYMADWILPTHDTEDRSGTKEYSDLFQKLMSYAKNMGCEDLVGFDEQQKDYAASFIFEEESPALDYIDEFENDSFWAELISRLAQRDALIELKANNPHDVESEDLFAAISTAEEKWSKEFEAFGLDRIRKDQTQHDVPH
ncbi:MAG: hypothetical protein LUP91_06660 [Methylococcaceae bacterium]|nr:hypothetical protein [Methylococcaceae bacterium]